MRRTRRVPRRYAIWPDYTSIYGGDIVPEADFDTVCRQAEHWLDVLSLGRIGTRYASSHDISMACCAVCDVLYTYGIRAAREPHDVFAAVYATGGDLVLRARVLQAARAYLWRSGVLSEAAKHG